jgi:hypothetical protein
MSHPSGLPPPSSYTSRSLVHASLDIGRVLADRDGVTFRAKGTCMYPAIRPGDVLRIQSRPAAQVTVGDIVVCRRPKYLFCHRVIETGWQDGRAYIVTRPDGTREGSDGPTFDEDLLGVVVAIERQGKPVPLQPQAYPAPVQFYFALRLALRKAGHVAYLGGDRALAALQGSSVYGRVARKWLALASPHISFIVRFPMPALGDAAYRQMSPETFDVDRDWRGRPVERWTLSLHLNKRPQPAAWARFGRGATEDWRVDELFVQARYRGAGLEEALLRQAEAILMKALLKSPEAQGT